MRKSEELMLLIELNNYDITKYKLKKQLEFEKTGNAEIHKKKELSDLLISHYFYDVNSDFVHRNPLTCRSTWLESVKSIDQFYFKHPELDYEMTIREFMQLKGFNEVQKESMLFDILDNWVEEYREISITQMENLRKMINLLPKKKNKRHRKPGKLTFILTLIAFLLLAFLFKSPDVLKPTFFPFTHGIVDGLNVWLYNSGWFSFLGWVTVLVLGFYLVLHNLLTRFLVDVRSEKNKHAIRMFDKWDNDMKNVRLDQSGKLEDYVDQLIKNPKDTFLDITTIMGPESLMDKFRRYVESVEYKRDWMTKNYKKTMRIQRWIFVLSLLLNTSFYLVGFALMWGWINV